MSAPMVRAILDGRKTQTRRVVKPQPESGHDGEPYWHVGGYRAWQFRGIADPLRMGTNNPLVCPYGQPGDRLWVRETFRHIPGGPIYDAAGGLMDSMDDEIEYAADKPEPRRRPWTPSIHMPRWASRITLEVTGVRVERLCDISEEDASAEGVIYWALDKWSSVGEFHHLCVDQFRELWSSINGAGSWDANPWVWAISFRRIDA